MTDLATYLGLFSAALLAATLFPAQSELVLAGLLVAGNQPVWALIAVATAGYAILFVPRIRRNPARMAAVAGLFQEAGYRIVGSDAGVYPPMSTMLDELGIKVRSPYSAANLDAEKPDLIVVARVPAFSDPNFVAKH